MSASSYWLAVFSYERARCFSIARSSSSRAFRAQMVEIARRHHRRLMRIVIGGAG